MKNLIAYAQRSSQVSLFLRLFPCFLYSAHTTYTVELSTALSYIPDWCGSRLVQGRANSTPNRSWDEELVRTP